MKELKLYKHQIDVLKETKGKNKVAYYLDMGLGKTFVGSEKLKELNSKLNLVVCQKSKIEDWKSHFKDYYDYKIFDLTKKKEFGDFINEAKNGELNTIGIINYDLIFRRNEFLKFKDFTLLLDESSLISNENAKRSKFILKLKPKNVILLSGTPISGRYEQLYSQIKLLGWNISKKLYYQHYIETEKILIGGMYITNIIGYKNVDRLKFKLRENGAVFMKTDEILELPKQNFITINVDNTNDYKKFKKASILLKKDLELVGDTILTKRLYLKQLASQYNKNKLEAFKDLVNSTNDRLLVFYNYNMELELLKGLVDDRPISIINGGTKDLSNYNDFDNSITFIQYQAGAMGHNLQKSNKIIYFSLTDKSELFEQSKKRIHRIGQDNPCFYYYLMTKDSIDQNIMKSLEEKKDYTDELFRKEFDLYDY